MRLSRAVPSLLGAVMALAVAPAAQAALTWSPCTPTGFECAKLSVPLDASGRSGGTVSLSATRVKAATNPGRVAVLGLAGGPGQAAKSLAPAFAELLGPALVSADLLTFDQRGTGESAPLTCDALKDSGSVVTVINRCAQQIGARRAFFTTPDSVADIESLRVAAGYDKLLLYGTSYGTKVALAYAAAHPDHVQGLLLDSVVPADGSDALRRPTFKALPRVLQDLCGGGACSAATPNVSKDLRSFVGRLADRAASGSVYDDRGKRFTARLTQRGLVRLLIAGDLNPVLRAELPAALRSALRGDLQPVVRLSANSAGLDNGFQSSEDSDGFSFPLFVTTNCEDSTTLPWTRGASISRRADQAVAAVEALPTSATAPFSRGVALDGLPTTCLGYPVAAPAPLPVGPPPAVPTLILDGQADLRTPVENAQQVQAQIPGAQLVAVPHTGHSVLGSDLSRCSTDAIAAFAAGQPAQPCTPAASVFTPTAQVPRSLSSVRAIRGYAGKVGRTLEALRLTLNDGSRQILGAALARGSRPAGIGGLRGGAVRTRGTGLRFVSYELVRGVRISGTAPRDGTAKLTVSGSAAARGNVSITAAGKVSGRLGGKRVAAKTVSAARAGMRQPLSLEQAIRRGRLARVAGS